MALSGDNAQADNVNEYMRKNFRKLSTSDAVSILAELAEFDNGRPVNAVSLQGHFWVWETLEEAIVGKVDELDLDSYQKCFGAFLANNKASATLFEQMETRMYRENVDSPFQSPVDVETFATQAK